MANNHYNTAKTISKTNNFQNDQNHFNKVLALQGLNALENSLRKQGVKTERVNCPLYKTQAFYEACGRNQLPLKQVPELTAGGFRYGLMIRLDAANRPLFKLCVGLDGDPKKYCQMSVEDLGVNAGWVQKSTWWQPGLTREERGKLALSATDAAAILADKYDTLDIGVDEQGRLAYAKSAECC